MGIFVSYFCSLSIIYLQLLMAVFIRIHLMFINKLHQKTAALFYRHSVESSQF